MTRSSVRRRNLVGESSSTGSGSASDATPKRGCHCCTRAGWRIFMQVFALVIAICAIIVIAISVFVGANSNAIQRIYVYATAEQVVPGPGIGVPGALLYGVLQTDTSADTVSFTLYYTNIPMLDRLVVRGPMDPLTRVASDTSGFYLCGEISPVCTPNTGGYLNATLGTVVLEGGVAKDPYTYILNLRADMQLYYMDIFTAYSSTVPSLRAYFTSTLGPP